MNFDQNILIGCHHLHWESWRKNKTDCFLSVRPLVRCYFLWRLTCVTRTTVKTHKTESSMAETPCSATRSNYLVYSMHRHQWSLFLFRLCDDAPPSVGVSPARMLHSRRPFAASLTGALAFVVFWCYSLWLCLYCYSYILLFVSNAIYLYYCSTVLLLFNTVSIVNFSMFLVYLGIVRCAGGDDIYILCVLRTRTTLRLSIYTDAQISDKGKMTGMLGVDHHNKSL